MDGVYVDVKRFKQRLMHVVAVPYVLLGMLAAVMLWQASYVATVEREVRRTDQVIVQSGQACRLLEISESRLDEYLETPAPKLQDAFSMSVLETRMTLTSLEQALRDDSACRDTCVQIDRSFAHWDRDVRPFMSEPIRSGNVDAETQARTKSELDQVLGNLQALVRDATVLRGARIERARRASWLVVATSIGMALVIATWLALFSRRQLVAVSERYAGVLAEDRRKSAALHESEERLRLLIASVPDYSIVLLDAKGNVVSWSAPAERVEGFREPDVLGIHIRELSRPEGGDQASEDELLRDAASMGRSEREGWRRKASGERFWGNELLAAVRDHRGALVGFARLLRDGSERRRAEEEREGLLAQAQRALRMRDEFLAIASHELRTPLTPLKIQIQALMRAMRRENGNSSSTDALRRLESVSRSVDRVAQLVDQLLDLSVVREGAIELTLERVDLTALVRDVVERTREAQQQCGSIVELRESGPVVGQWDRLRIDQVVTNLISNAMKYGGAKPVEVSVGREGDAAILSVSDHGIGIAKEDQERIFRRFERAVSNRHYGGFGVGLWVVQNVAQAHGGTIRVTSMPGKGATFTVQLPTALRVSQAGEALRLYAGSRTSVSPVGP